MKRVMVFGVFDGLHEGHRAFLKQARALGDELVVVLTPDSVVEMLKHHPPKYAFEIRKETLERDRTAPRVVEGDTELGSWSIVRELQPSVVAIGYDQRDLAKSLQALIPTLQHNLAVVVLSPHEPEKYKSSLANKS